MGLISEVSNIHYAVCFCLFLAQRSPVGQGLLIHEVSRSHTTTHHSRQDSSGRVISSSQRPLPDNTQHSQQTNIHAPRWDSNPRSQQASGRRPTPQAARPLGSAITQYVAHVNAHVNTNNRPLICDVPATCFGPYRLSSGRSFTKESM